MGRDKSRIAGMAHLGIASGRGFVGLLIAEMVSRVKDLMTDKQNTWKHDQAWIYYSNS